MRRTLGILSLLFLTLVLNKNTVFASSDSWYESLEVQSPYDSVSQSGEYIVLNDGEETPSVDDGVKVNIKRAGSIPTAYMNTLSKLKAKYPAARNQGNDNTCWAFSAAGLAEFDLIADNASATSSVNLSEAQIAYSTYHNFEDELGGTSGDSLSALTDYIQFGGSLYFASRTLLQWQGVVKESFMPYGSSASALKSGNAYIVDQDVAHMQNAYILNIHKNRAAVKKEIINHGSAGIGMYISGTKTYGEKYVYKKTGETVRTYYCSEKKTADHALNIVGWDDNFPASAFAKEPEGNGAWLVRNSGSTVAKNSFGSYFWVSYYDKSIEDEAWIFDLESADNYDYNYQYDGGGIVYGINKLLKNSSGESLDLTSFSNIFKVQGTSNELISAVSVTFNEDSNVPYEIEVYTDLSDPSDPTSGVLSDTVTGAITYAGTYTIPLNTEVSVEYGSYFSVVVKIPQGKNGIDAEYSYDYRNSSSPLNLVATASIGKNQSFIYYKNKWRDLSEIGTKVGNLCIKAFTKSDSDKLNKTTDLKKTKVTKTSAAFIWAKTSGATGYEIYRSAKKNGTYKKIATVKSCSYTDKNRKKNKTYYYKVRAYKKSSGNKIYGKFSGTIKVTA